MIQNWNRGAQEYNFALKFSLAFLSLVAEQEEKPTAQLLFLHHFPRVDIGVLQKVSEDFIRLQRDPS